MRFGLIADIHGNLHALEAAIRALRGAGVDGYVCAGDLVGYGAFPNECAAVVDGLNAHTVAGNHDLIALGQLSDARCIPLARSSLCWTREALRDDTRRYLAALPLRLEIAGTVVLSHGSLDDPQEYVTRQSQAAQQLGELRSRFAGFRYLVLGHTHRQRAHTSDRELRLPEAALALGLNDLSLINPGSVGQSRDSVALARFGVLDLEARSVTFMSAPYDVAACRAALQRAGRPAGSCHLAPSLFSVVKGRVRRALQYVT